MVPSYSHFHNVGQESYYTEGNIEIYGPDGAVVGSIGLHSDWTPDGNVRAQLELRFEDKSSLVTLAEIGLEADGHEARRSWVLVEMEPRKSFTESLRFSINIPGAASDASDHTWDVETDIASGEQPRPSLCALPARCEYPHFCDGGICDVVAFRRMRKLADDRRIAKLESLATQSLHA
jgi:hypothetical protein